MSKLVLVLNCGSSSLKFAVIDATTGDDLLSGLAECFNLDDARIKWKLNGEKGNADLGAGAAHQEALDFIVHKILPLNPELSKNLIAIGHRVVHGGERFTSSVRICDDVIAGIEAAIPYAPLHNPAHLIGIRAALKVFPELAEKNVAVFDTAFHQTMPEEAFLYALPYKLYKENGIRRYGAHGTSHYYISLEAAKQLNKPVEELNIINCHLGNGGSVCAIKNGLSVDTSMGLTPLEGLVMGTRSGDIDPSLHAFLARTRGLSLEEITGVLNNKSGLLGLSGLSNDMRTLVNAAAAGNERARLAIDVFCYRLAKNIAALSVPLGKIDALIFTGGIGENSKPVRKQVLQELAVLGFSCHEERNEQNGNNSAGLISEDGSTVALVVPTDEELMISQNTYGVLQHESTRSNL